MTKEVEKLKRQIKDLESELAASMKREEMRVTFSGDGGSLRQKVKNKIKSSRLWRAADDPNDKLGKVIRSPRTIARIVTNPDVIREIREKNRHVKNSAKDKQRIFMPIRFFLEEDGPKRINIVLTKVDIELIKMGILLANKEGVELRIITTKEKINAIWYRNMIKNKELPKSNNISFYDTTEQDIRVKPFELEVSEKDLFLTRAWIDDGRR